MNDDELVRQILLGDKACAEELINRYYASVLRYCRWHCPDMETAEDLTQETFYKLFQNLLTYKGKRKFKAYLYTIANHICIDAGRKNVCSPIETIETAKSCTDELQQAENRLEVSYLLNLLSPTQREAVLLRFGEQLTFYEIAKVMNCKIRTAQSRVRNALKIMRKEIRNEHESP